MTQSPTSTCPAPHTPLNSPPPALSNTYTSVLLPELGTLRLASPEAHDFEHCDQRRAPAASLSTTPIPSPLTSLPRRAAFVPASGTSSASNPSSPLSPISPASTDATSVHAMDPDRPSFPDTGADKGKGKARARRSSMSQSPAPESSASSQGDMADTEMEAYSSSHPGAESSEGPSQGRTEGKGKAKKGKEKEKGVEEGGEQPVKKKRTRTLTTPHQAAVLHALLAQSRFPTTAMREEVGRSIGLSARKVQIWFQNQRQKARRPKGQNIPPLTRPPQFGPFPSVPSGSSVVPSQAHSPSIGSFPSVGPSSAFGTSSRSSYTSGYTERRSHEAHLAGPGVPGTSPIRSRGGSPLSPRSARALAHPYAYAASTHRDDLYHEDRLPLSAPAYGSFPRMVDSGPEHRTRHSWSARPFSSTYADRPFSAAADPREPEPESLRLPPLRLPSRNRSYTVGDAAEPSRPPSQDSPFAYSAAAAGSSPVQVLPPPFTLEPRPQWDDPSFSPFSRRPSTAVSLPSTTQPAGVFGRPFSSPASAQALPSLQSVLGSEVFAAPTTQRRMSKEDPDEEEETRRFEDRRTR